MDGELRNSLLKLIKHKFARYPNVMTLADDIVHDAYIRLRSSKSYAPEKEHFGYLSMVCIRLAYRMFMAQATDFQHAYLDAVNMPSLIDESEIVNEIIQAEDANAVLESLKTLRDIERVVITQRYYGDFSFARIAEANGLKLNTVLSHHRRALGKWRPKLTHILRYEKEEYYE